LGGGLVGAQKVPAAGTPSESGRFGKLQERNTMLR